MVPIGYMYKNVAAKPDWLNNDIVKDLYSVSPCISGDFAERAEWIDAWKHNGYWLFDAPQIVESIAFERGIELETMSLFFYLAHPRQWDDVRGEWIDYSSDASLPTDVQPPRKSGFEGFDVVSFSSQTAAECSPLSCNGLAHTVDVNEHCLIPEFETAMSAIERGLFKNCEPGPYRIIEVRSLGGRPFGTGRIHTELDRNAQYWFAQ